MSHIIWLICLNRYGTNGFKYFEVVWKILDKVRVYFSILQSFWSFRKYKPQKMYVINTYVELILELGSENGFFIRKCEFVVRMQGT